MPSLESLSKQSISYHLIIIMIVTIVMIMMVILVIIIMIIMMMAAVPVNDNKSGDVDGIDF
jgi:hypothetical protein